MQVLRASLLLAFIIFWQLPLKIKHSPSTPEENREESKWETGSLTRGFSVEIGVSLSNSDFLRRTLLGWGCEKKRLWSIKGSCKRFVWVSLWNIDTAGYQVTMCGRLQYRSLIFLLVILYTHLFCSGLETNKPISKSMGRGSRASNLRCFGIDLLLSSLLI